MSGKTGRPRKIFVCSVDGCERKHVAKGWCAAHYKRFLRWAHVDPSPIQDKQFNIGACSVAECQRPAITRGYCEPHYQRVRAGRPLDRAVSRRGPRGNGSRWKTRHGYVMVVTQEGRRIAEHRHVMEQHLNRQLRSDENVHHKNGIRDDNRLESLELWASSQPAGQRVEDLLSWASEIIARYG